MICPYCKTELKEYTHETTLLSCPNCNISAPPKHPVWTNYIEPIACVCDDCVERSGESYNPNSEKCKICVHNLEPEKDIPTHVPVYTKLECSTCDHTYLEDSPTCRKCLHYDLNCEELT